MPKSQIQSIRIGAQEWMAHNLDFVCFQNGDPIPQASTRSQWEFCCENGLPAWCFYDWDEKNGLQYGKLYNQFAVFDSRGLAPEGWHIPTMSELMVLLRFLGGLKEAPKKLKSKSGWYADHNGSDDYGFCGLPGGQVHWPGFDSLGHQGFWWCVRPWVFFLHESDGFITKAEPDMPFLCPGDESGYSVRCLKDVPKRKTK